MIENRRRRADFVVRNEGLAWLRLLSPVRVNISGPHAEDFRVIVRPAEYIAKGGRSLFTIRFDPSAEGQRNAWVVIRSSDPETPRYTFKITGEGFVST